MDKIVEKDFQRLKRKSNIKRVGSKLFSIPKLMGEKLFSNFKKVQSGFKNLVNEDVKQEYKEQKVENIEQKLEVKSQMAQTIASATDLSYEDKNFYLNEIKKDYNKLIDKKTKVASKGLGVFALSKITLTQIKKSTIQKLNNARAQREQDKRLQKLEEAKNELLEYQERIKKLNDEISNIQNNIKDLVSEYPELTISENTNEESQVKTM